MTLLTFLQIITAPPIGMHFTNQTIICSLVLVLKCSNQEDHSIISIKQRLIEFVINLRVSCNCGVQQSSSHSRKRSHSSPHKPVRLEQRLRPQRLDTVDYRPMQHASHINIEMLNTGKSSVHACVAAVTDGNCCSNGSHC